MRTRYVVAVGSLFIVGFACGYWTRARGPLTRLLGRSGATSPAKPADASGGMTDEQREKAERLMALGYVSGYDPPTGRGGVLTYDRTKASPGLNLVVSGHEPSAILMDMDAHVLHRWHKNVDVAFRGKRVFASDRQRIGFWKRVHLFRNGDLLAMWEGTGIVKLDRSSKVIWAYPDSAHHDLDVDHQGNIFLLTKEARVVSALDPDAPVLEDRVLALSPDGRKQRSVSILEALLASPYGPLLRFHRPRGGDVLHTNTLAMLDERQAKAIPSARKGNVLLAIRSLDFVGVMDLDRKAFVWGVSGMWREPHEPVLLDDGHLLVFDNFGYREDDKNYSRVLEIDPATHQVSWSWAGPPRFVSKICGLVQRLPNGNTLVTASTEGRALEVTPQGKVVWEFLNPHEVMEEGQRRVATLFELQRLPRSEVSWLEVPGAEALHRGNAATGP